MPMSKNNAPYTCLLEIFWSNMNPDTNGNQPSVYKAVYYPVSEFKAANQIYF